MTMTSRDPAEIRQWLMAAVATVLKTTVEEVDTNAPFAGFGLDSLAAVELSADLGDWLGERISPTVIWDYPTIDELSRHLAQVGSP
jgi:acyl carrier protein